MSLLSRLLVADADTFAASHSRQYAHSYTDGQAAPVEDASASKPVAGKALTCRLCKGNHYTAKCPYKDELAAIDNIAGDDEGAEEEAAAAGAAGRGLGGTGKYVPPYVYLLDHSRSGVTTCSSESSCECGTRM